MARYANDVYELEYASLVLWNGQVYAFLSVDGADALLIPAANLDKLDIGECHLLQNAVSVPIQEIQIPDPEKVSRETLRSLFRLEKMPWELIAEGQYPFACASPRLVLTEEDLLCVINRMPMLRNPFLHEAWDKSFVRSGLIKRETCAKTPECEREGILYTFLVNHFLSMMEWFDPEEDDWKDVQELRDFYLDARGKPLTTLTVRDDWKSDMAETVEDYCKRHPVTDEIRAFYERLLEECRELGWPESVATCAYAYYGGNAIVGCDWKKAEQALLTLYDPDKAPDQGVEWAANSLGYIYGSDRLGEPDYRKALICFSYAADHDMIEATYKLSDLYRVGLGTEKNPVKAWMLLSNLYSRTNKRRISEGKYADICLRMGYCYRDGVGVEPDSKKALCYFRKALRGIQARMKTNSEYGDEVVARKVRVALDSIKEGQPT